MHLQTLGGLRLEGADFHRPKPLLLLAYLAVEGAKDRRHLAELFWPDASEPATSLRVALGQLRKGAPGVLNDDSERVALGLETDVTALLEAVREARFERLSGLYMGAFLQGFVLPDWGAELEEWVYATREFLASQVRGGLVRLAQTEAERGHFLEATKYAAIAYQLPAARPLEPDELERLHVLLLVGDHPLAGEVQREAREFGLELRNDPALLRQRYASLPTDSIRSIPHNLPGSKTSFIGRDLELVEIGNALSSDEVRLITLLGPGGIGKTRLALQAAHDQLQENRFGNGVFFVALENLTLGEQVSRAVAGALGATVQGNSDPLETLQKFIAQKSILLVLDNFEHLTSEAAMVSALLEVCPNLVFLVTSRERLQLEEEFVLPISGVPVPTLGSQLSQAALSDAVRLFVQRAKRARLDFVLSEPDLPAVLEICDLVEGSPLGIELAAALVKMLPLSEIVCEIMCNLDVLETNAVNAKEGHRSLRAVFEQSWTRLSIREQAVFAQLSVFQGGFTREAASEVAGATIPVLASLIDKSLLRVDREGRYDRHALLHQYALEKLQATPNVHEQARERHYGFYLALTQRAEPQLRGPEQAVWFERIELEHPNLRSTLGWALERRDGKAFLRCCRALRYFWVFRGHVTEGRAWLTRALEEADIPKGSAFHAEALTNLGVLSGHQGDLTASGVLHRQSLAIYRTLERPINIAAELNNLSVNARYQGQLEEARECAEESLSITRSLEDRYLIAENLNNLASIEIDLGRYAGARSSMEESLEIQRALGNTLIVANMLVNLGEVTGLLGDPVTAQSSLEEALTLHKGLGNVRGMAYALINLGDLALGQDDRAAARAHFQESLPITSDLNDLYVIPFVLEGLAATVDPDRAARMWGAAEALRETTGSPMPPNLHPTHQSRVDAARDAFGDVAFGVAWAQGRTMTLEQTIKEALEPQANIMGGIAQVGTEIR
jgi:predicted ATPase